MSVTLAVLYGFVTDPAFGIPLFVVLVATLFWIVSRAGHLPPLFQPIAPDRTWARGPFAWVMEGALDDRLTPAVSYSVFRVETILQRKYHLAQPPRGPMWWVRRRLAPEAVDLVRLDRRLTEVYQLAQLSERNDLRDFVSRWRKKSWRRNARTRFSDLLPELERTLLPLEASP